jgi:formate dehydrogenase subunit delta
MSSSSNLVKMANQIGAFFESMPEREQALTGIAGHIKRYWDPRMRRALLQHIAEEGGTDLSPLVVESVNRHRADLE